MDVKVPQSHIPVFTPRKPPKSSPTTLSIPSLGLATPSKHLSVSAIPSSSSSSSSGSGGLASFRSFRNLFSTASSKQTSSASKTTFAGFGSIRRSTHGDRNVSAAQMSRESSCDDSPVLDVDDAQPQVECGRNDVECNGGFETPEPLSSRSSSGSSLHAGREKGMSRMFWIRDFSRLSRLCIILRAPYSCPNRSLYHHRSREFGSITTYTDSG